LGIFFYYKRKPNINEEMKKHLFNDIEELNHNDGELLEWENDVEPELTLHI